MADWLTEHVKRQRELEKKYLAREPPKWEGKSRAELIYGPQRPVSSGPDGDGDNDDKGLPPSPRDLDLWKLRRATKPPSRPPETKKAAKSGDEIAAKLLTDKEIVNIIFNETRSLSGKGIEEAWRNIAHAILNGEEEAERLGIRRPHSAPTFAHVPVVEKKNYNRMLQMVKSVRTERAKGIDPTGGATHFNFRNGSSTVNWDKDYKNTSNIGPFGNSYPTEKLDADGIYANTYKRVGKR